MYTHAKDIKQVPDPRNVADTQEYLQLAQHELGDVLWKNDQYEAAKTVSGAGQQGSEAVDCKTSTGGAFSLKSAFYRHSRRASGSARTSLAQGT